MIVNQVGTNASMHLTKGKVVGTCENEQNSIIYEVNKTVKVIILNVQKGNSKVFWVR